MFKGVCLNGHTGCVNRGCEAIIKSTMKIFNDIGIGVSLSTHELEQDKKFDISEFIKLISYSKIKEIRRKHLLKYIYREIQSKIFNNKYPIYKEIQMDILKNTKDWLSLNVGGDTYCYGKPYISYALNKYTNEKKLPNILWGCSIEKEKIDNEMRNDLLKYTMIFPREKETYDILVNEGIPNDRMFLMSDPAFNLDIEKVKLPNEFETSDIVGINISPLVIETGKTEKLVWDNIYNVIDYILNYSKMSIALIPHVYNGNTQDIEILSQIYEKYNKTKRVIFFDDFYNCKQLKYIISNTKLMIAARTHASIAAYSTFVPTLVLGYSVKSKGIAKDLFGTYKNYVMPVQELSEENQLLEAYKYIEKNQIEIKQTLQRSIPQYRHKAYEAAEIIKNKFFIKEN